VKKILIILLVIVGVGAGVAYSQLNSIVETGIETAGPEVLKVDVTVGAVSLSPFSGKVAAQKLAIGQPAGFGDGSMMALDNFSVNLETSTLMNDHIIIDTMMIDGPLLDVRRQDGQTNFEAFQEGLGLENGSADAEAEPPITLTIRKLVVKAPRILAKTDGFIKLDEDITLADFTLTDLGTDEKGLAPKEIARHVMDTLQPQITKALVAAGASSKVKDLADKATEKLESGLGGLLGKLKDKKKKDN
jgi:hypothetical protein